MNDKGFVPEQGLVTLVPIGLKAPDILEVLIEDLARVFARQVRTVAPLEIPASSYNSRRNQYRAPLFLEALYRGLYPEKNEKVLGLTDKDLYVRGLNFVFGQAELPGVFAVISLARLHQNYYGLPENRVLFSKRVLKEAVHELGHTFGLKHCPNSDCVMFFSNSLYDTDRKSERFCPSCKSRIEQLSKPK